MSDLVGHTQGRFSVIEWYDINFERYGTAYVAIEKTGSSAILLRKETQPPRELSKEAVNNWIYDNWNVYDPRKSKTNKKALRQQGLK